MSQFFPLDIQSVQVELPTYLKTEAHMKVHDKIL